MKNCKKIITLLCAFAATLATAGFAACNVPTPSSTESSLSSESSVLSSETESSIKAESSISLESSGSSLEESVEESSLASVSSSESASTKESSLEAESALSSESSAEDSSTESSIDSSMESTEDSSLDSSSSSEEPIPVVIWSEWEAVTQPTCTEDGEKTRFKLEDPTEMETAPIAARGHNYSENNGTCKTCGDQAVIPPLTGDEEFPLIDTCTHTDDEFYSGLCNCEYKGRGEEYSRLELTEGCYTVETMKNLEVNNAIWLSFSIQEAGQYMLYSVDNNGKATAIRHDANAQYVNPNGKDARVDDNGDFYSYVSCTENYFNKEWRATYCIKAKAGTLVKICFVKIGDPVWEPKSIYSYVYPTEINGKKAPNGGAGYEKTVVPYDSKYYYSDPATGGDGYYHLQTGEIIFAAINSSPERLLLNGCFNNIHFEGSALTLPNGITADGDYNVLNYVPFIMNCMYNDDIFATDENGNALINPNKNCYQNYCNTDGLYPVNAELFKFLNLYVQKNKPIDSAITEEDWEKQAPWLWLSACYFYAPIDEGTQENPLTLTVGTYQLSLPQADDFYCAIQEAGTYKITCSEEQVWIYDAVGETTITITSSPLAFIITSIDGESKTITITVEKIED